MDAAARLLAPWASCLPRSVTLQWLLRRRRMEADLRIGVRKVESGIEAHAWVEHRGRPLNDTSDVHRRYAAFDGAIPISDLTFR